MTRTQRLAYGALLGVAAAGAALGTAEPLAALVGRGSSPVVAVGLAVIDAVPRPVKEFGIATFGQHDKIALLTGVFAVLAMFALVCGVAALRLLPVGIAGIALFGAVGVAAAGTRPGATLWDATPSLVGTVAAVVTLVFLRRAALGATAADTDRSEEASPDRRRGRVNLESTDRRGFLALSLTVLAASATLGAAGRFLGNLRDVGAERLAIRLPRAARPSPSLPPGADQRLPDLTPFLTPPGDFYRVDTALVVPQISVEDYRLRIHGRVFREVSLSYQQLLDRPLIERVITLSCVSNEVGGDLAGTARWLGVPLKDLLDDVGAADDADQLLSTSVDGWTCGTPVAAIRDGRDAMLVVGMNGEPLPLERGYPVRLLVPGLYGYVSATKWLADLELTRFADARPYWVKRGWKAQAPIKTFSRIDTPRPLARTAPGRVTVAGVAWAPQRGIERVEVRVDGSAWQTTTLAAVPSIDTWRQWRWDWDAKPGRHTLEVRATDRTGVVQPEKRETPFPNGASGWHSVVVVIE